MIVDIEKFNSLKPRSGQFVLCRCDACGRERPARRYSIGLMKNGTYTKCRECWGRHHSKDKNHRWLKDRCEVQRKELARKAAHSFIHKTLRRLNTRKADTTHALLGYTSRELYEHLERSFEPGMSWEDRGAWHIDHIKPIAQFVREGITDIRLINALSNLRPVWALENLRKHAKWEN